MSDTKPKVTKAVIGAAGFGTRFLPQTKAVPKEMLPIVDRPIIQYIVEELVEAGVTDIFIHARSSKRATEDHFDLPSQDLVNNLEAGGPSKAHLIEEMERLAHLANFAFIRVKGPYGNATPVLDMAHLLGNEPFIYTFADDFFVAKPKSRFQQMIELHETRGGSVVSCMQLNTDKQYDRYGVVGGKQVSDGLYAMDTIVEKPGKAAAPSNLASVSSYLFEPEIARYILEERKRFKPGNEFYIQPAMRAMMDDGYKYWGLEIKNGTYYDTGDKLEYLKTVVDFALAHEELGEEFRAYLDARLKD